MITRHCHMGRQHAAHDYERAGGIRMHCPGVQPSPLLPYPIGDDGVTLETPALEADDALLAIEAALPDRLAELRDIFRLAEAKFQDAYAEYGDGAADETGLAGQWADLHRKVRKLKRAMWGGDEGYLTRENAETILFDLIGHAVLAIDMHRRGLHGGRV